MVERVEKIGGASSSSRIVGAGRSTRASAARRALGAGELNRILSLPSKAELAQRR
jgi:hypothetical protein